MAIENLSYQLIDDLSGYVDPKFYEIFNSVQRAYSLDIPIKPLIEETLNSFLDDLDKTSFQKAARNEKKNRKRTKQRLESKIYSLCSSLPLDDDKHPFHRTIVVYNNTSADQQSMLFGSKNLSEIIEDNLKAVSEWANTNTSMLIECPTLAFLSEKKVLKYLKSDLFLEICEVVASEFEGDLKSYLRVYPNILTTNPLFGIKRMNLEIVSLQTNKLIEDLIFGNSGLKTIYTTTEHSVTPRSLDEKDRDLIITALSYASSNFVTDRTIILPLRTYAKVLAPNTNNPSSVYNDMAMKRINSYPYYTYQIIDSSGRVMSDTFNIVDRVRIIKPDGDLLTYNDDDLSVHYSGDTLVEMVMGSIIVEETINAESVSVSKNLVNKLENEMAKLIVIAIQQERINCFYRNGNHNLSGTYDYIFFQKVARMPTKRKKDNIMYIVKALTEFKEKNIIVKDFRVLTNNSIEIHFHPLSQAEQDDLAFFNKPKKIIDMKEEEY